MAVKWSDFGCSLEDNQLEKELGEAELVGS